MSTSSEQMNQQFINVHNLKSATIGEAATWRTTAYKQWQFARHDTHLYYNFYDHMPSAVDACKFLQENVNGIVAMALARLHVKFPDWIIIEVVFETAFQRQELFECATLDLGDSKFADAALPLPPDGIYDLIRFNGLPLEAPHEAVQKLTDSLPFLLSFWVHNQYARPTVIDIVPEDSESLKKIYSGSVAVVLEGADWPYAYNFDQMADIKEYGSHAFKLYRSFREYCRYCKLLDGGHDTRTCPKSLLQN